MNKGSITSEIEIEPFFMVTVGQDVVNECSERRQDYCMGKMITKNKKYDKGQRTKGRKAKDKGQ